jgi:hypothetical protein
MNNDLLILIIGVVCLVIGGILGWIGTYVWLLRNSDGVDAGQGEGWYL